MRIFAVANRKEGLPLESAFALYSNKVKLDTSLIVQGIEIDECSFVFVHVSLCDTSKWSESFKLYFVLQGVQPSL